MEMDNFESWDRLMSMIPADELLPDTLMMENYELNYDQLQHGLDSSFSYF